MIKILLIGFFLFMYNGSFVDCKCDCLQIDDNETTHYGGNKIIKKKVKKTYKFINGQVVDVNGEPVSDVLVEIFDNPEWILSDDLKSSIKQKRLFACKTDENGKFCLKTLPAGDYELRLSKSMNWNPSYIYISVDSKSKTASADNLEVVLYVG